MPGSDTLNKLATVLAISGSAYLAGFTASISILTVPVLPLAGPTVGPKQWSALYARGSQLGPPMGLISLSLFAYTSWAHGVLERNPRGLAFALAGLLAAGNVPWTKLTMKPTNAAIQRIADEPEEVTAEVEKDPRRRGEREREVQRLVGKWQWLNAVRSLGPMLGALVGGVAAVGLV